RAKASAFRGEAMATVLKIGPIDHGRPMTLEEFHASDGEEGYQYELIDGRLYVTPDANAPQGLVEKWLFTKLDLQVPSIKEYWILDTRDDPDLPIMVVHRRHGKKWRRPIEVAYG